MVLTRGDRASLIVPMALQGRKATPNHLLQIVCHDFSCQSIPFVSNELLPVSHEQDDDGLPQVHFWWM